MTQTILICIFLGAAVLAVAAGCAGLVMMRSAAAKLHFASAAALIAPPFIMAAVLCQQGLSQAGLKAILLVVILFMQGPVAAHVMIRAIHTHERLPMAKERSRGG
ncbi:MAG TPA: monovalent cation/H(+) antiporter subunit G [Verrucomicrobiae bacterium]|nr:monovalent cation/H(+) antiporter subunit G [Verrucomicrobiae bacterium]